MVHFSRFASAGRAAIRAARASSPMPQLRRMRAAGLSESLSTAVVGVEAYARNLQWFHWGMAGGILAAFGTVYTANADGVPPGAKAFLMRWHSSIGMLVLGALGGRIFLRFTTKIPEHLAGPWYEVMGARAAHAAMYPMMAAMPLTGIAMSYYGGGGIPFFGVTIPGKGDPKEADMAFAKSQSDWHTTLGNVFEVLVPLHIGAAGYHMIKHSVNPLPRMATPEMISLGAQFVAAAQARPGAVAGGVGLAAASGLWLGSVVKAYVWGVGGGTGVVQKAAGSAWTQYEQEEIEKHNTAGDLWIAVEGSVYDMTKYHLNHPGFGGPGIILKNAGKDATHGFQHAKHSPKAVGIRDELKIGEVVRNIKSELAAVHNLDDMKKKAEAVLTPGAEVYYNAGAEDGTSMKEALEVWDRDWRLRPRNFIDVTTVDMTCKVLAGSNGEGVLQVPIMAAPTALLKMGHEDGEAAVARGCQMMGVGNCLSTTASLSIEDVAAASPDCYRWFQLYVYKDHNKTKSLVLRAAEAGYSAIVLTVDLPVLGNRTSLKRIGFKVPEQFKMANMAAEKKTEADKKLEVSKKVETGATSSEVDINKPGDRAAYIAKLYDQSLTMGLLTWLGTLTDLPIVIKGVLRGDSAEMAAMHPSVRGIVVSNHGGRQLDNCIAPLTALPEIVRVVDRVNIDREERGLLPVEVYVDGGIKRGRDVFKALALGAKAVMMGRPMIYGMAVGGELGVARTVEIIQDELKTIMQLSGTQDLSQINRTFVLRHGTDTSTAPEGHEAKVRM